MPLFERDYRAWQGWVDRKLKKLLKSVGGYPELSGNSEDLLNGSGEFSSLTNITESITESVLSEVSISYLNKPVVANDILVPQTDWLLITEGAYTGTYKVDYTRGDLVNYLTVNTITDVIPDISSIDIIKEAEIYPLTETFEGFIRMYSKNLPTGDITINLNIFKV